MVRGLDRTRRDSAGSEGDGADGERSFEMQPVVVGEGEAGDTGDDELVVHREEEEEGVDRTPKKLKTLFGLPPIVMMKLY